MTDQKIIELYFNRDEAAIRETEIKYGRYCRKVASGISFCQGPNDYVVSPEGEFIILDPVSSQVLVYVGNDLKLKFPVNGERRPSEVHCTDEGYIVNYESDAAYSEIMSEAYDKNGKYVENGTWFTPADEESKNDTIAFLPGDEGQASGSYAELIKLDEKGNYYIRETRYMTLESSLKYFEFYISKYNAKGELTGYAIYDYSGMKEIGDSGDGLVRMDDKNNIYIMRYHREELIIYQVTLGRDDEAFCQDRIDAYIADSDRYKINEDDYEGEVKETKWIEILDKEVTLETQMDFKSMAEGGRGYIMEINDDEIVMEMVYRIKAYPYGPDDFYEEYTQERKTFRLAEDVKVWAWALYAEGQLGIMDVEDITDYERSHGYKTQWVLYLNEAGEVECIFEPFNP